MWSGKQCSILIKMQRARDDKGGKVYIKTKKHLSQLSQQKHCHKNQSN